MSLRGDFGNGQRDQNALRPLRSGKASTSGCESRMFSIMFAIWLKGGHQHEGTNETGPQMDTDLFRVVSRSKEQESHAYGALSRCMKLGTLSCLNDIILFGEQRAVPLVHWTVDRRSGVGRLGILEEPGPAGGGRCRPRVAGHFAIAAEVKRLRQICVEFWDDGQTRLRYLRLCSPSACGSGPVKIPRS